jgi:hypothetical protein
LRSFLDLEGFEVLQKVFIQTSKDLIFSRKILKNLRGFGKPQRLFDPLRSFLDLEGFEFLKEGTE